MKGFQYLLPIAVARGGARRARLVARVPLPARGVAPTSTAAAACGRGGALRGEPGGHARRSRVQVASGRLDASSPAPAGCRAAARPGRWIQREHARRRRAAHHRPLDGATSCSSTGVARPTGCRSAPTRCTATPPTSRSTTPISGSAQGEVQYLVWDSFSAARSPFFSDGCSAYVERYNGRVVHTESVTVRPRTRGPSREPMIVDLPGAAMKAGALRARPGLASAALRSRPGPAAQAAPPTAPAPTHPDPALHRA